MASVSISLIHMEKKRNSAFLSKENNTVSGNRIMGSLVTHKLVILKPAFLSLIWL